MKRDWLTIRRILAEAEENGSFYLYQFASPELRTFEYHCKLLVDRGAISPSGSDFSLRLAGYDLLEYLRDENRLKAVLSWMESNNVPATEDLLKHAIEERVSIAVERTAETNKP